MAAGQSESVLRPLRALLESGSMTGMTDGQLVERFAARRDAGAEAAFAVLVARHGPMVLGVCRHLVGDEHAADDAFQAVFLVLARRAGSMRRPDLLGPWLHGVAARIARKARARSARQRRRESPEVAMMSVESTCDGPDPRAFRAEDAAAVHEEIGRLPDRYRRAVVLCHFEGLTHAEAARRLGCAPGTVGSLVSRARDMLRGRLARRGLSSGAILLAGSLEPKIATAAVPLALERATIRAALLFATDRAVVTGIASAAAVELARGTLQTMSLTKLAVVSSLMLVLGVVASTAGGFAARTLRADDPRPAQVQGEIRDEPARVPSPSLPGAVTKAPPWLVKDAPFDVAAFFAAPPPEENAAPRYLDALFEFGEEMEVCFPEGPERESRKQAAEKRTSRMWDVWLALDKAPNSVPAAKIDALLDEYDTGFRKLSWAQQRPRCVFLAGLGVTARNPHLVAVRFVSRIAPLRVRRELERGELDAALRDLARLLRLYRDLRPRGEIYAQSMSAFDGVAAKEVVLPLLTAPGLTVGHCDRLMTLLVEHETQSVDPYTEGLRGEYLSNRATLHDLVFDQDRLRAVWESLGQGLPARPTIAGHPLIAVRPSIVATIAEPTSVSFVVPDAHQILRGYGQQIKALASELMSLKLTKDLDARIARTTPEELSKQVEKLNQFYSGMLALWDAPYLERIRRSTELPPALDALDLHTRVTRSLLCDRSGITHFTQSMAWSTAWMRDAQGLVAVRRWELRHGGESPPSLEAAAKEAGLAAVPIDPYDGRPIHFSIVDGQPTVYCIGQDGRDDGGKTDTVSTFPAYSGDVLIRLPKR